jgi:hypothetical protein
MKKPKRESLERLTARCNEFNARYPVGTEVEYHPVIGEPEHSIYVTCHQAEVLSGHTAIIWLKGKSGCVALDAIVPTEISQGA